MTIRGSDGYDYEDIADRLIGAKAKTTHNIGRAMANTQGVVMKAWAAELNKAVMKQSFFSRYIGPKP